MDRPRHSTCHNKHFVSETLTKVYNVGVYPRTYKNNSSIIT